MKDQIDLASKAYSEESEAIFTFYLGESEEDRLKAIELQGTLDALSVHARNTVRNFLRAARDGAYPFQDETHQMIAFGRARWQCTASETDVEIPHARREALAKELDKAYRLFIHNRRNRKES